MIILIIIKFFHQRACPHKTSYATNMATSRESGKKQTRIKSVPENKAIEMKMVQARERVSGVSKANFRVQNGMEDEVNK